MEVEVEEAAAAAAAAAPGPGCAEEADDLRRALKETMPREAHAPAVSPRPTPTPAPAAFGAGSPDLGRRELRPRAHPAFDPAVAVELRNTAAHFNRELRSQWGGVVAPAIVRHTLPPACARELAAWARDFWPLTYPKIRITPVGVKAVWLTGFSGYTTTVLEYDQGIQANNTLVIDTEPKRAACRVYMTGFGDMEAECLEIVEAGYAKRCVSIVYW